eukprot:2094666-Prymnesium_polylepis.1
MPCKGKRKRGEYAMKTKAACGCVWEGGTTWLGRFWEREGGWPGWQHYIRPSTHTHAHTSTYTPRDRE